MPEVAPPSWESDKSTVEVTLISSLALPLMATLIVFVWRVMEMVFGIFLAANVTMTVSLAKPIVRASGDPSHTRADSADRAGKSLLSGLATSKMKNFIVFTA